jgi:hypothetical protein
VGGFEGRKEPERPNSKKRKAARKKQLFSFIFNKIILQ